MTKKIKITESTLSRVIERMVKEDFTSKRGYDVDYEKRQDALTPGKNPEAFYGDDSLDKLRKFADNQEEEMSKEDIIQELVAIYSYSQDGATEEVNKALENMLYRLEGFKDDVNESKQPIKEQSDRITQSSMERYMDVKFQAVFDMISKYNQK